MSHFKPAYLAGIAIAILTAGKAAFGQDGVSTAGEAHTSYLSKVGIFPSANDVAVEDFVNYGRKEIARPKAGQAVGLDLRWERDGAQPNGEAVLQVGLSTALQDDASQMRPLNLAFAIDISGSMADDNKLVRVKESLDKVVMQLRPTDLVSVVVFDSDARVLVPAEPVTDPRSILRAIDSLTPGSCTNLDQGLMLAYQEDLKNLREGATNRVILLTDGIANRGVTEPDQIAQQSQTYNDRGIDLCTIGLGRDVNQDLLRTLANSGRGLFHFIADDGDIQKVFADDLQSQLSPVAADPNLQIDYDSKLKLEKIYGFEPSTGEHSVGIKLGNLNSGATEVVLLRFRVGANCDQNRLPVHVNLSYYDIEAKRSIKLDESSEIDLAEGHPVDNSDPSVEKNYTIARVAQSIKDMASACAEHNYKTASQDLDSSIHEAYESYPNMTDQEVQRVVSVASNYRKILNQFTDTEESSEHEDATQSSMINLVPNGDFSQGNAGFQSTLPYIAPSENALWGGYYTIAPSFENPDLHSLIQAGDYSAPSRSKGTEQVLYANAGGTGSIVMWSSIISCKPHTHYRISLETISLSGSKWNNGREIPTSDWVADYQICIGSQTSAPQAGGCGHYATVSMDWDSKDTTSATLSIVRLPFEHGGGLIGIANIKMSPSRSLPRD